MIEHFVPLKFTHDEMTRMRDAHSRLIDLQTLERIEGRAQVELFDLEDSFGDYEWLVARIVNAAEAS